MRPGDRGNAGKAQARAGGLKVSSQGDGWVEASEEMRPWEGLLLWEAVDVWGQFCRPLCVRRGWVQLS